MSPVVVLSSGHRWKLLCAARQALLQKLAMLTPCGTQVMVYIKGTGVSGVVQQALESLQTPNLLLQTPLTHVPDVIISPSSLEPVVLYEGSFSISDTQTILLNNTGNATVEYEVRPCCLPAYPSCCLPVQKGARIPYLLGLSCSAGHASWVAGIAECMLSLISLRAAHGRRQWQGLWSTTTC